jgi:acyl-CoA synthetase (AMP-forming)/AMP-acid ligase II
MPAGAPLQAGICMEHLTVSYGLTETASICVMGTPEDSLATKSNSVGRAMVCKADAL